MEQLNRLTQTIVTGTPNIAQQSTQNSEKAKENGNSFLAVLQGQLESASNIAFSKHAVSRVHERQIDVSTQNLQRLDQGVKMAQDKGLREALILIDQNAYIVNAASGKVITVDGEATQGSVFTNIDGTVII